MSVWKPPIKPSLNLTGIDFSPPHIHLSRDNDQTLCEKPLAELRPNDQWVSLSMTMAVLPGKGTALIPHEGILDGIAKLADCHECLKAYFTKIPSHADQ